jgi:hypothetical protein
MNSLHRTWKWTEYRKEGKTVRKCGLNELQNSPKKFRNPWEGELEGGGGGEAHWRKSIRDIEYIQ